MKQLTQAVFEGKPDWIKSAAIHPSGYAKLWSVSARNLTPHGKGFLSWSDEAVVVYSLPLGDGFDATDWQNSAIDRIKQ